MNMEAHSVDKELFVLIKMELMEEMLSVIQLLLIVLITLIRKIQLLAQTHAQIICIVKQWVIMLIKIVHSVSQDALLKMISVKDLNAHKDLNGPKLANFVELTKKEMLQSVVVLIQNDLSEFILNYFKFFILYYSSFFIVFKIIKYEFDFIW